MGFEINPYDQCLANCQIDGKQCTVAWFVDDSKISHQDPAVVTTKIIDKLEEAFKKMTVVGGPEHVFLRMNICYNKSDRTATITMSDYLKEAIAESEMEISKTAATPANKDLFETAHNSPALSKQSAEVFHSIVANKLLYISIRARMDLLLATSFLTTQVFNVVSRDSVHLAFLIAGLNNLDVLVGDVMNVYLNAPCRERIWFEGQTETGEDQGKVLIVTRALYGLKSLGAAWRADLAATLHDIGFTSTQTDPDVWIRSANTHNEMILVYVNDILVFAREPKVIMNALGQLYELKPESVKEPDLHLGANMEKVQLPSGKTEWAMTSRTHVKNAVKVVESLIIEDDTEAKLKSTAKTPFPGGYKPKLDVTTELNDALASRFLQLMGILRWTIELASDAGGLVSLWRCPTKHYQKKC